MEALLRLLLRVILVPAGAGVAIVATALVASVANWAKFKGLVAADLNGSPDLAAAAVLVGAGLVLVQSVTVVAMLLPGVIAILVSEALAIRSWIFHALAGGLSIWVGWTTMDQFGAQQAFYDDPKTVIAAGLAGGFAYWAVAGWSAGFWKPVFRNSAAANDLETRQ